MRNPLTWAPVGDLVIIIAARNRGAGHQKQHFPQRVADLATLARVADDRKVIQHQRKTVLNKHRVHGKFLPPLLNQTSPQSATQNPLT